jgi:hypothetical protein
VSRRLTVLPLTLAVHCQYGPCSWGGSPVFCLDAGYDRIALTDEAANIVVWIRDDWVCTPTSPRLLPPLWGGPAATGTGAAPDAAA